MTSYIIRSSIFGIAALLALTFIPAGTLDYWQGWAYVATWVIACSAYTAYVAKHDPALFKRRTEVGVSHEKEPAQKIIISEVRGLRLGEAARIPRRLHSAYKFWKMNAESVLSA